MHMTCAILPFYLCAMLWTQESTSLYYGLSGALFCVIDKHATRFGLFMDLKLFTCRNSFSMVSLSSALPIIARSFLGLGGGHVSRVQFVICLLIRDNKFLINAWFFLHLIIAYRWQRICELKPLKKHNSLWRSWLNQFLRKILMDQLFSPSIRAGTFWTRSPSKFPQFLLHGYALLFDLLILAFFLISPACALRHFIRHTIWFSHFR